MRKFKIIYFLFLVPVLVMPILFPQAAHAVKGSELPYGGRAALDEPARPLPVIPQTRESMLKAGFVEKFTRFVEWDESRFGADTTFKIAVIGENDLIVALVQIFMKVKVKDKKVIIKKITSANQLTDHRVLVISGEIPQQEVKSIVAATNGKHVLTIGESKGYGKLGLIINMIVVNDMIRFEVNKGLLERSGLKMSSLLLNSAILIE